MRPQHITAENNDLAYDKYVVEYSFNEAAAYHCGKRRRCRGARVGAKSFNEAAAYHCGKLGDIFRSYTPEAASMRPQHITAENAAVAGRRRQKNRASMRPQHITAENASSAGPPRGTYSLQ